MPEPALAGTKRARSDAARAYLQPVLVVQTGHILQVNEMRFSPDGQLLATASADETIKLWDVAMGREIGSFLGSRGPIYALRFSADSRRLVSGGWDRTARVWDVSSGRLLAELGEHQETVQAVALSPEGAQAAVGIYDRRKRGGAALVWDVRTRQVAHRLPVSGIVSALDFSPGGELLAVGDGASEQVILFRTRDGSAAGRLEWQSPGVDPEPKSEAAAVRSLSFSADGTRIAAVSRGSAVVLDARGQTPSVPIPSQHRVYQAVFDRGGSLLLMHADGIERWDLTHMKASPFTTCPSPEAVRPDGEVVARQIDVRDIALVDRASGKDVRRLGSPRKLPSFITNLTRYFVVAASPMYPVVASGGVDGIVRAWNLRAGGGPRTVATGYEVRALEFNSSGTVLAGAADQSIKLWRTSDWALYQTVNLDSSILGLAFNPSGFTLAALTERHLHLIDANSGTVLSKEEVKVGDRGILSSPAIAWSPDGTLMTSVERDIVIWRNGRPIKTMPAHSLGIHAIALGPEGRAAFGGGYSKWMYSSGSNVAVDNSIVLFDPNREPAAEKLVGHKSFVRAVAFDLDGRRLASGGGDGTVKIWDVATSKELTSFTAHGGDVTAVAFTSDGRYVVSTGLDGALRLWDAKALRPAATLVALGEEDFAVVLPDGHYTASKGGLRGVTFRVGNQAVPFEQFDLRLNRPDIVWSRIGYALPDLVEAYRLAHERRVRRMKLSSQALRDETTPPEVEILSGRPPIATSSSSLRLRVRARDTGRSLARLMVYVNDVPVPSGSGVDLRGRGATAEVDVHFSLSAGDNKVELYVMNGSGMESSRLTFRVVHTAPAPRPDLYVVAIGVAQYADPKLDLKYAAKDAVDLVNTLTRVSQSFGQVRSHLLPDRLATREAILHAKRFISKARVDDQVVIFLAGHGRLHRGAYMFLPFDYDKRRPEQTGISYEELEGLFDGIAARRRLMLIDTCHAGEPDDVDDSRQATTKATRVRTFTGAEIGDVQRKQTLGMTSTILREMFADLRKGTGAIVIASAGAAEYAVEDAARRNGVFTWSVLEALQHGAADANHDGVLRVSELQRFVSGKVVDLTAGKQSPSSRRENLEYDFPVR